MKTELLYRIAIILYLIACFSCSKDSLEENNILNLELYTYVPDDKFEEFLIDSGYDDKLNNYVLTDNIKNVTSLTLGNWGYGITGAGIKDFTGIEGFENLESFTLNGLGIGSLNLSKNVALKNLRCEFNNLTVLDLSNNPSLEWLICRYNNLTVLDLSNNPSLSYLECDTNNLITLNVSQCPVLKSIICWNNNITILDISNSTILESLNCSSNQITSLDVSNNTSLSYLNCHSNQFTCIQVNQEQLNHTPHNWTPPDQDVIYSTNCN